ncbi:odorant receptor 131-2-like, partial [Scleropages formosus]|uniref:odorant receptor 131-2-like n=1 Tax=Scleropages formosus TaxID=113540 RepID=UPI0010FA8B19
HKKNVIVVFSGIAISCIHVIFIFTFSSSPVFYMESRYILYIHLVINDMILLCITVTLHVVSYAMPLINVSVCCVLLLVGSVTTKNTPMSLAGMAVERYIAICKPLRHSQICTVRRTYMLISLICSVAFIPGLSDVFILVLAQPLTIFSSRVLCYPLAVFKTTYHLDKTLAVNIILMSFVWIALIYTYFRVLFTTKTATTDPVSTKKAQNTILLHGIQLLFCMMSYITPLLELILFPLFPNDKFKIMFANFFIASVLPRFLTPFIYGIRDQKFVTYIIKHFSMCTVKVKPVKN